jgi:hypothetical protein
MSQSTIDQVADLVDQVLRSIRGAWYPDDARGYLRDRTALTRAIARWGHECRARNWLFDAPFIERDIIAVLKQIKRSAVDIKYLPVYLEGAITRSIGQRAEELSALAKRIDLKTTRIVDGIRPVAQVIETTATETLAILYRDLRARQGRKRRTAAASPRTSQPSLL